MDEKSISDISILHNSPTLIPVVNISSNDNFIVSFRNSDLVERDEGFLISLNMFCTSLIDRFLGSLWGILN